MAVPLKFHIILDKICKMNGGFAHVAMIKLLVNRVNITVERSRSHRGVQTLFLYRHLTDHDKLFEMWIIPSRIDDRVKT